MHHTPMDMVHGREMNIIQTESVPSCEFHGFSERSRLVQKNNNSWLVLLHSAAQLEHVFTLTAVCLSTVCDIWHVHSCQKQVTYCSWIPNRLLCFCHCSACSLPMYHKISLLILLSRTVNRIKNIQYQYLFWAFPSPKIWLKMSTWISGFCTLS